MSFRDIKGQGRPVHILKESLNNAHLAGGYLFSGPDGVGKRFTARALAKAVNCEENILDSCDKCESCLKIENNRHPDVHMLENADAEIKIEDVRRLQREAVLRPYEAKSKVFIIDNAHNLNAESSNALLKILEEPPKNSLIILISDKPGLLFKTIISRCKVIKFSALPREDLREICRNDFALEDNLAHYLAYFCEGRLGLALRLKDADILRKKNRILNSFILSPKLNPEDFPLDDRSSMRSCLNILATWVRDIYLLKTGLPHRELINLDRREELLKQMARFSYLQLNEILDSISEAIFYLDRNINSRLLLYNLGAQIWKG